MNSTLEIFFEWEWNGLIIWVGIFNSFHNITGYSVHPLMVCMVLLSLPLSLLGRQALKGLPTMWLGVGTLGAPLLFAAAERSLYPACVWWKRFTWLPLLTILGTGVAVSNTKPVISGLLNIHSPFQRTQKTGVGNSLGRSGYVLREPVAVDSVTWMEFVLAVYAFVVVVIDIHFKNWFNAVYLSIYCAGFAWVALATLWEAFSPRLIKTLSPEKWDIQMG